MAARLAGISAIRYFADSLVYKPGNLPGNNSVVGWYTDRSYWGDLFIREHVDPMDPVSGLHRRDGASSVY